MKDLFTPGKFGDYVFECDICGNKEWASNATNLDTYTGRGGLIVCISCKDPIDYGIVPYKIPAEKNVPWARDAVQSNNPSAIQNDFATMDYEIYNPLYAVPWFITLSQYSWDLQTYLLWNNWNAPNTWEFNSNAPNADANYPGGGSIDEDGDSPTGGLQ